MRSKRDFSKTEIPKIGIKFNLTTIEATRNFFNAIFASKMGGGVVIPLCEKNFCYRRTVILPPPPLSRKMLRRMKCFGEIADF